MIIAVSGTPGIGKTSATKELKKILDFNTISIKSLVARQKIPSAYDKKRDTKIISIRDLKKGARKEVKKDRINVIEGHLAHLLDADLVIILRCRPDVLEGRMKNKGWKTGKISENIQSEILDVITAEALENNKRVKVLEIDTTYKNPEQIAVTIKKILNSYGRQKKYIAGKIDWSEKYASYLINKK